MRMMTSLVLTSLFVGKSASHALPINRYPRRPWVEGRKSFRYDRNVMTYKIMNRLCPESLWDKFQPRSFHSTYNTRHCKDLQIPRYRTEFAKKGFHYAALTLWNDTPAEIRELPTLDRFKKRLKTHLKS